MAVNKNFVVKNGLEVKSNLLVADTSSDSVGIGTSFIKEKLHVMGGIGATTLFVGGIGTVHVATGNTARYENINITGLGTIATLSSNAVNAVSINASGIVTANKFYGDGSTLTGVSVGVRTAGAVLGYGVTFLDIRGSGVSTAYFNTNVGIATLNFEGGGSGGSVSISSAAPTSPNNGDLWYSIDYGRTFVYYDEVELGVGSTAVWVDAAPFNNGGQFIGAYGGTAYGAIGYTAGTASSTSLYFTGDPNTGLYQPTADQMSVSAGGVGVVTFNPGGFYVGGAATVSSDLSVAGNLNVTGDLVYDEERGANILVSGVATATGLNVLGISSVKDLNVVGVATIATLNATTVTPQNLTLQTGVTTNATNTNLTVTGITTIVDSKTQTGVTTNLTATNLTVTGITTLASATVTATSLTAATGVTTNATNTLLKVTGVSTFASAATFSDDVTFTGAAANVTWDKSVDDLIFGDNAKAAFGASSDLTLYHDSSHSYISDQGTGSLKVLSSDFQVNNAANAENMITASEDGAAALYYNGTSRIQTTNTGVNVTGTTTDDGATHDGDVTFTGASYNVTWDKSANNIKWDDGAEAKFGTGGDLRIYHDGSNSYLQHEGTGNLIIYGTGETLATFADDGAVTLYHNNTTRLATTSSGVSISGVLSNTTTSGQAISLGDNAQLHLGTGDDLKLYHDGSDSYIADAGTGKLRLLTDSFRLSNADDSENMIAAESDGSVSLFFNNSTKLATTSVGVNVTGNVDCDSVNVAGITTITGDLFLDNGSTAGRDILWDVSDNALKISDNVNINIGTGNDLKLYHDGSDSYISNTGGNLYIEAKAGETAIQIVPDAAVQLRYNGAKKLVTEPLGVTVYGSEGEEAILYLYADDGDDDADKWRIQSDTSGNFKVDCKSSGSWANKVTVSSAGAVTATSFVGDGSSLTGIAAGGGAFNTSISEYATYAVTTSMATAFTSNASSSHRTIVHSCRVTNISSSDVTVSANIAGTFKMAWSIPVPAGSSVELFKKPKTIGASTTVQLMCSANNALEAAISAERQENTDLDSAGLNLTSTSVTDALTMSAAGVFESMLCINDDGSADVKATVEWTNGSNTRQAYLAYEMVIPAASSVEILEQPLAIPSGHKIRVTANVANRLDFYASFKRAS